MKKIVLVIIALIVVTSCDLAPGYMYEEPSETEVISAIVGKYTYSDIATVEKDYASRLTFTETTLEEIRETGVFKPWNIYAGFSITESSYEITDNKIYIDGELKYIVTFVSDDIVDFEYIENGVPINHYKYNRLRSE